MRPTEGHSFRGKTKLTECKGNGRFADVLAFKNESEMHGDWDKARFRSFSGKEGLKSKADSNWLKGREMFLHRNFRFLLLDFLSKRNRLKFGRKGQPAAANLHCPETERPVECWPTLYSVLLKAQHGNRSEGTL